MPGATTLAQITNAVNIMLAESKYTLQDDGVMKSLVRNYKLGAHEGKDFNIPKYGTVEAFDLTEGIDMVQGQQITDSKVTITPNEVGVQVILTDKMMRHVRDDMLRVAGKIMGNAMVKKMDTDLMTLVDGFSNSMPGDNTALAHGHIMAAHARLRAQAEPAPESISCVLHPYQWHTLAKDLAPAGTYPVPTGISQTVLENYWRSNVLGTNVYIDNNVLYDAGTSTAKGGIFSKEAVILLTVTQPDTEKERDASLRAWEVNTVSEYGFGEYMDTWGIELLSEAALPTS